MSLICALFLHVEFVLQHISFLHLDYPDYATIPSTLGKNRFYLYFIISFLKLCLQLLRTNYIFHMLFTEICALIFLIWLIFQIQWTSSTVWYPWIGYSTIILLAFAAIKIINLHLHLMFDQTEPIEERPHDKHSWRKENHSNRLF